MYNSRTVLYHTVLYRTGETRQNSFFKNYQDAKDEKGKKLNLHSNYECGWLQQRFPDSRVSNKKPSPKKQIHFSKKISIFL